MRLIYVIFKFILFPGTYVRGFWEHLTCKILHLPVESEGYLRADEACGHVEHALATTHWSAWLMATGPGFMMFNAGMAFLYAGVLNIFYMGITPYDSLGMFIFYAVLIYLGVSFLCSLFPLTEDILTYWDMSFTKSAIHFHVSLIIAVLGIIFLIKESKIGGLWIGIIVAIWFSSVVSLIFAIKKDRKEYSIKKLIISYITFPLALVTRIGAFFERNCINFLLAIAFIVLHIVLTL